MTRAGQVRRIVVVVATAVALMGVAACDTAAGPETTSQATVAAGASATARSTPSAAATSTPTPTPSSTTPAPVVEAPPPPPPPTAGPPILQQGNQGDRVRELQARLAQIKWFNAKPTGNYGKVTAAAVSGFQGKRGLPVVGYVDQATWDRLVGMTRKPTQDQLFPPAQAPAQAAALDPRCMTGRAMCIDKTSRTLRWVVDGTVSMTLAVRFGSQFTPTREGTFSVTLKSRDHWSTLYDTAMPYAMFFSGGQAVHYSADFAAHGYDGASHGCVNVRDKGGIASLFGQVNVGDRVIVYRS